MARDLIGGRYQVRHSEWTDDPYGWQTVDPQGNVIDTYELRKLAQAWVDYMNILDVTR